MKSMGCEVEPNLHRAHFYVKVNHSKRGLRNEDGQKQDCQNVERSLTW